MGNLKILAITTSIFVVLVLVVFAWTGNHTLNQAQVKNNSYPHIDPNPSTHVKSVELYYVDKDSTELVPVREEISYTGRFEIKILEQLIDGPNTKTLNPTIPRETKIISLDIVDKIAFVNFSKDIQSKHWGGSASEMFTVESIVYTLTQFDNIDSVQILIEGRKLETLLGHVNIMGPLSRKDTFIGN